MSKAWYTISFDSEAGRSLPEFSRERTVSIGKTIQWQGCSWEILDLSKTHVILAQIFEPGTYISFTPQIPVPEFPTKPVLQPGKLMRTYPAVHACGTTLTPRFEVTCECPTYSSNAGVCKTFQAGSNGRCVYCDHTRLCHSEFMLSSSPLKTPSHPRIGATYFDTGTTPFPQGSYDGPAESSPKPAESPAEIARQKIYDLWKRLKPDFGQASSQAIVRGYIEEATAGTSSPKPLHQEFTLWLVEYEKSTGLVLDSRSAFIGWQAALATTKEQP